MAPGAEGEGIPQCWLRWMSICHDEKGRIFGGEGGDEWLGELHWNGPLSVRRWVG